MHISTHGAFIEGTEKGFLELENGESRAIPISIETLGTLIRDSSIQLVYLDACQTATGSLRTPLTDLSYIFLEKGVPAVLAMQFSVPDDSATKFCEAFYAQIAKQTTIECALTEARKRTVDLEKGLDRIDWAIPTLFVNGTGILMVEGRSIPKKSYKQTPSLAIFVGREERLNEIFEDLIDPDVSLIIIDGFGGIGKSTFMKKFVKDIGHIFKDVCWIDCELLNSYDLIIEEINKMMIHHGIGFTQTDLAKYNPEEKNIRISYVMMKQEDGFLLVFDNFDTIKDDYNVRNLIEQISVGEKIKTFLTIRIPESIVRKERIRRIDKLYEHEAILLIRKIAEKDGIESIERASYDVLKQINERLDGHPKAIEIVITLSGTTPLEEILTNLPQVLAGDIGKVIEWSLERLSNDEKELLFEISIYEGRIPYNAIKAIHSETPMSISSELVRKNILNYDTETRLYHLHPLIRDFIYNKIEEEKRKEIHRRAANYYLSEEVSDPIQAIGHRYKAEDWKTGIAITLDILDNLILRGSWAEAKKLSEEGLSASKKISDEKLTSILSIYNGQILQRLGDYDEAEKLYRQSLKIEERLGNQSGIATTLHQMAMIRQDKGDYDEAEKLYRQSLEIKERLGNQSGIAITFGQLGRLSEKRGDEKKAYEYYERAFEIFHRLGIKEYEKLALEDLNRIKQKR